MDLRCRDRRTTYTAYQSRPTSEQIAVRLIVRRVKDKNVAPRQGELFTAWRYHAFITDSALELVQAEKQHREHAIIEQVNADLKDSALAHMPSAPCSPRPTPRHTQPDQYIPTPARADRIPQWKSWADQRYPRARNHTP